MQFGAIKSERYCTSAAVGFRYLDLLEIKKRFLKVYV